MTTVKELKEWLESIEDQKLGVGVDEGGLTLLVYRDNEYSPDNKITKVGELTGDYYEVGGVPREIEDDVACSECRAPLDDGEGYDGLCGNCADKKEPK